MDVFVVDACRTPIGRHGGSLSAVRPDDLAAAALRGLLERNPYVDGGQLADVYWGAANQSGEDNRNVARMAVLLAGLPETVPGMTVNRLCGSGLQAVVSAWQTLRCGWADFAVAGGSESMSRAPWVMLKPERRMPVAAPEVADTTVGWRLVNPHMRERYEPHAMGMTAEIVADRLGITRTEQDEFALRSHQRAVAAARAGVFADELLSLSAPDPVSPRRTITVDADECPRPDTTLEVLGKLPAAFRAGGAVTAGNSAPLNDGAAAVLLATGDAVRRHGLTPMARVVDAAVAGVHPDVMGLGPVPATRKLLARTGWDVAAVDLVELNEAFAAQSIGCIRELGLDPARTNVNGGAIALGHPLGASGARITASLVHEMRRRSARRGIATMCIGVGQGISLAVEAA